VDLYDDAYALQDAKAKAEEIKKELSTAYSATRPLTAGGRPVMFTIDRRQFEGLIAERLRDVRDTIENTIAESGIARERLTSVLMVGGSSRIPAFQEMVRDISGRDPVFSRNLDEDVARGAAIYAAKLSGDADPRSELARMPVPVDAASHGLGVTLMKDDRSGLYNEILIAAGTALPARAETVIVTANNGQHAVDIDLNEGDDTELDYVRQLGSSTGEFAQPVPAGYGVRLTMSYTPDQLVTVQAFDHQTGQHLCDLIVPREGRMSAAEQQEAQAFLKQLEVR
jgi:molecular chaperone DnaK